MRSLLLFFYGSSGLDNSRLPYNLENEISLLRERRLEGLIPTRSWETLSWHRMSRGRKLNLILISNNSDGFELRCYEDFKASMRLKAVRDECFSLKRDAASTFVVCQAILDGCTNDRETLVRANLSALKSATARRIISKAKAVLKESKSMKVPEVTRRNLP